MSALHVPLYLPSHDIFLLLPCSPPSNRKAWLLPRDMYACVTCHGSLQEIEEKLGANSHKYMYVSVNKLTP